MKICLVMDREELNALGYPVIVELWDRVAARTANGSKKRRYLQTFNENERAILARFYTLFYQWYLVKGTPQEYIFRKAATIDLIRKAVCFFATI